MDNNAVKELTIDRMSEICVSLNAVTPSPSAVFFFLEKEEYEKTHLEVKEYMEDVKSLKYKTSKYSHFVQTYFVFTICGIDFFIHKK